MMKQSESQCTNHTNPQNNSFSFISIPHCPPLKYTTPQIKHLYDATLSSWRNDSRSRANAKTGRVLPFRFLHLSIQFSFLSATDTSLWHSRSSNAARTAAITKAENVHSLPRIVFSTLFTISLGNRMVLLTVGGMDGILNLPISSTSQCICFALIIYVLLRKICIALALRIWYHTYRIC